VCNCAPCHLPNVDGKMDQSLVVVLTTYDVCCVSKLQEPPLCWFETSVLKVNIWDVSCHQWKKCKLANGFALGAPNRLRFLRTHSRTNPRFSSMVIHIWLGMGIWRIIIKQLMIGLTFAPGLMVLLFGTKVFIHGGFPISSSMMLFGLGDLNPI
jgi:hypothetical protein